jgi:uncharacterized protein YgiM (DUF1202 family)
MKKTLFFIMLFSMAQTVSASTMLYVQSATAKLLQQPSFKAGLVVSVDKGVKLEVIETSGRWIKVKHNEQVGWVSKLLVSNTPPAAKPSLLQGRDEELEAKARRRASSSATAAATRGLRSEDRSRMSDEKHVDYEALQQVENVKVKKDEVEQFQQEGLHQQ